MSLTHLLDTSVFSQPIKDRPVDIALSRWEQAGDDALCTSAICLAELKQGLETRRSARYWGRYHGLLENHYVVLPFDSAVASTYARMVAQLVGMGRPKPTVDLFIAATARTHGLILATLNTKDFLGIPGLAVEDWGR